MKQAVTEQTLNAKNDKIIKNFKPEELNEMPVIRALRKCDMHQLKRLYRDMKRVKTKGTFGYQFLFVDTLPEISIAKRQLKRILQKRMVSIFSNYIIDKSSTVRKAMTYDEWKAGSFGYEMLVEQVDIDSCIAKQSISTCLNYIDYITNNN